MTEPASGATRTETDSMGPIEVPADRYWGAQTQRSIMNFPIGWEKQPIAIVRALGVIKQACAMANKEQGTLDAGLADAIIQAEMLGYVEGGHLDGGHRRFHRAGHHHTERHLPVVGGVGGVGGAGAGVEADLRAAVEPHPAAFVHRAQQVIDAVRVDVAPLEERTRGERRDRDRTFLDAALQGVPGIGFAQHAAGIKDQISAVGPVHRPGADQGEVRDKRAHLRDMLDPADKAVRVAALSAPFEVRNATTGSACSSLSPTPSI